jgi:hypothetical protein
VTPMILVLEDMLVASLPWDAESRLHGHSRKVALSRTRRSIVPRAVHELISLPGRET